MSEKKESDLLKKPVKVNDFDRTVSNRSKAKSLQAKRYIKGAIAMLSDSEFDSLVADLNCLDPKAIVKIDDAIANIKKSYKLQNKPQDNGVDISASAKVNVKSSSTKTSRSCVLL